jgi:hypothetical protein
MVFELIKLKIKGMKEELIKNLRNPEQLEKLYRSNKSEFTQAFNLIYPEFKDQLNIQFWNERINYKEEKVFQFSSKEFKVVLLLVVLAGLLANISNFSFINPELFFSRNTSFIIIPFIAIYFLWKQNLSVKMGLKVLGIMLASVLFINLLPNPLISASINLTYIHLPIFLWSVAGLAYLGNEIYDNQKRINFLKYNGDLLVICVVLFLAGLLFTLITFGLFELIGIKMEEFYVKHIAIWAIGGIPIIGTYLISNNPKIINKVTPIIAKIFTPLVFVNLTIYLVTLISKGKYPHHDRNLLLIYNALLVGVLALIFFSVAEIEKNKKGYFNSILLFGLSILTIIVNAIALSAICYRLFEYGITPNRIAVLGGNILIFINLLLVSFQLLKAIRNNAELNEVQNSVAKYLPIYAIWTGLVTFLIPFIFSFK